jgi:leucyl aminopeptidase (aminopeptidase T)
MAGSPLKRARRLAAEMKIDPLDEAPPRPKLAPIPWNKVELTDEQRTLVAQALAERRTRAEVAAAMGISAPTLRRLIRDDPALTEAVEAADEAELDEIRSLLMAHGRAGDTVALIFLGKAFHGLRDRDDAAAAKVAAVKSGGVLLLPADVPLDEWEAAAAAQQAQFRERSEVEPVADFRTRSVGVDGLIVERTMPGDLP